MKVDFRRLTWENYPSTETPLNADNLNRLEEGVAGLYSDMAEIEESVDSLETFKDETSAQVGSMQTRVTSMENGLPTMVGNQIDTKFGSDIGDNVTTWLTEHVTPSGSAVVVDNTLSIEGAAADAKKTGDELTSLKEDITTYTGNESFKYTKHLYFPLNGTTASTTPEQHTADIESVCVPCSEGDVFYINAVGAGNKTRAFGFISSNGTVLSTSVSTEGVFYRDFKIVAPANSAYLLSNNYYGAGFNASLTKNKSLVRRVSENETVIDTLFTEILNSTVLNVSQKFVNSATGELANTSTWSASGYVTVSNYKHLKLTMPTFASVNSGGLAFYDSSKNYISGIAGRTTGVNGYEIVEIEVPTDAKYARFSFRNNDKSAFTVGAYYTEKIIGTIKNNFGMQMFEKIGVISDSISCGWALDKNGNRSRRNIGVSWVQQMARRLGCTAYNLGASGVDPIEWFETDYEFYQYCLPQYQSVGECDVYIIGLGLNGGTMGSTSDINQSDYTQNGATFYGQYARIIQMINAEHPNAIVMCLTEPTTAVSSYDQAVRDICALSFINAELVDLENDYFDLFNTPEILAEHQPDGLHFTPYGYSLLADATMTALNDYISKNTNKFKYVGVATV